jgi:hypothetical protein
MIISIPLFSTELLIAAALIGIGMLLVPLSHRAGVVLIGAGSALMAGVVMFTMPHGLEVPSLILFGISFVVGAWMVMIGLRKPA